MNLPAARSLVSPFWGGPNVANAIRLTMEIATVPLGI
jgi:hypothetical protein